ncbi:hypothetical protein GCM10022247_09890 [Allokutzneria multivorans]|uniref:Uncharacterized protein n=1 Tax=Allokutzneria multivorans TaxID=1142134 RepID=A0ABP7R608_9PSEU
MTVTLDKDVLGLSDSDWQTIVEETDAWNDDFTTDELSIAQLKKVIAVVDGLSTTYTALADLSVQLRAELETRKNPPVTTTTTTTTTTTVSAATVEDAGIPEPPAEGLAPVTVGVQHPVDVGETYDLPQEHTKVGGFASGKIPLRQKNLVDLAVKAYYGVNREDVVADIKNRYDAVNAEPYTEPADAEEIRNSKRPGYKDSDAVITGGNGTYPPHWPVVPTGPVPVHGQSVTVFRDHGHSGQAYTGIVRFGSRSTTTGAPEDPKIILFPTQAEGAYLETGVRTHPLDDSVLKDASVYGEKPGEYTTHSGQGNLSSHGKLSEHIAAKDAYSRLAAEGKNYQESGLTIGFTVIRGGDSTAHKFSFISRSSNNPTFALLSPDEEARALDSGGETAVTKLVLARSGQYGLSTKRGGAVTREWADKIISSVEAAVNG